ncbi:MAG: SDR family oxidoreductase, partial [Gammaproteobacteria bacterium]
NARYGIRANVILPGLMNTPMAIEPRVGGRKTRDEIVAERDRQVPLGRKMGSAWDVAHAAAFLASDRAGYITGIALPVDGGLSVS